MKRISTTATKALSLLVLVLPLLTVSFAAGKSTIQPEGWDDQFKLAEAVDTNPDPHVVEVNLLAGVAQVEYSPGQFIDAWTYNGGIPGPLIRVNVGDRLIVHFTNKLPQASTVHWHGIRVPIEMDGVPGVSQPEVPPGGSFTYDFIVPDAGLFWYHPHVMSAKQVGFGLYGAVLVEDPAEDVRVPDELVLVLSDWISPIAVVCDHPKTRGQLEWYSGLKATTFWSMAAQHPKLTARAGAPQRWRIVNTAKSRYFEMQFAGPAGKGTPFTVIGGDGGLQEYPPGKRLWSCRPVDESTPSSRRLALRARRSWFDRFHTIAATAANTFQRRLVHYRSHEVAGLSGPSLPDTRRSMKPIERTGATRVNMDFTLVQVDAQTIEYRINNMPAAKMIPVQARVGETQIWTIKNETKWSHPVHLHGFFFQVLDKNGEPVRPLAWRDTIDVPFDETLRLIVKFDDRPGTWMFHCHILDHAEGGLMTMVELGVENAKHAHQDMSAHDR